MKIIVGLGNPGNEHKDTRHNAGFLAIDFLVSNFQLPEPDFNKKINAMVSKGLMRKKRAILAKPQTFMNSSGLAVKALLNFYKSKPQDLIIIHDDKDILLGETRVQKNRGPAGHNGVKSVIEQLCTQDFTRIRIGVAPADTNDIKDTAGFVLGKFTKEEKKALKKVLLNISKEVEQLIAL